MLIALFLTLLDCHINCHKHCKAEVVKNCQKPAPQSHGKNLLFYYFKFYPLLFETHYDTLTYLKFI